MRQVVSSSTAEVALSFYLLYSYNAASLTSSKMLACMILGYLSQLCNPYRMLDIIFLLRIGDFRSCTIGNLEPSL